MFSSAFVVMIPRLFICLAKWCYIQQNNFSDTTKNYALRLTDAFRSQAVCQDLSQNSQPIRDLLHCPMWPAAGYHWGRVQVPSNDRVQPWDWLLLLRAECYGHTRVGAIQEDCWYWGEEEARLLSLFSQGDFAGKKKNLLFALVVVVSGLLYFLNSTSFKEMH